MYREILQINVKKLSDFATIPTQGTKFAAGYDLYAAEDAVVVCGSRKLIKTNISMEITPGYYGRIAPRSGLAYKSGIDVLAGVIDCDYRGDIGVILYNTDKNIDFTVKKGDRIAQIIFEACYTATLNTVENLDNTLRQGGGYGSTGV
jgi:deoxyuridine 5'-triphosphate nucleotidohydrolase